MTDYLAIGDAIAARYASGLVTPPTVNGAQLPNIALSTARPPNALVQSPSVVVWANRGDVIWTDGRRYDQPAEYLVNFYYAPHEGDIPRESAALQAWLGVLLGQLRGQAKLGTAGVMKALPVSWQIGALDYAGISYAGITITIQVWTEEVAALTP